MHHRISKIWKNHLPKNIDLNQDVNLARLSMEFELTGGFIHNAVCSQEFWEKDLNIDSQSSQETLNICSPQRLFSLMGHLKTNFSFLFLVVVSRF